MRKLVFVVAAAGTVAAASLGLAQPALAAPSGPGSAQQQIDELSSGNNHVIVTRIGGGSINNCSVTSVRMGHPLVKRVGEQHKVMHETAFVTLTC